MLFVAYFLKKQKQKNRTYLAIYESFYHHEKKQTAHRCYKSLGSVETLKANGIDDPIAFYQNEVDKLNLERNNNNELLIGDVSPLKHLGYFPLKAIISKLEIRKYISYYKYSTSYHFDLSDILEALVYARAVHPCSKRKTFHDVIPSLFENYSFSYDQLLEGLEFYGCEYEKIIELFTHQVNEKFGLSTSKTYFDCTNFFFEIDREDDFRRKGPSKENRKDPIVGMGLLLDENQIPIGMKLYPGNESEKPVLRNVIDELKKQNNIKGKTVHVADKGLNCAENIAHSILNKDGYLFSKSVKQLPEKEKIWILLENDDWKEARDNNNDLLYRYKSCIDEFDYYITDNNGKKKKVSLKEKRLVTYNPHLAKKKRYEISKLIEKAKTLKHSQAKRSEFGEAGKYVLFESVNDDGDINGKAKISLNEELIEKDLKYAGYNLLVTSEINMSDIDIYNTYHNLWRIEESFKIMKSDLDARPVYLQMEETIKGHFLICYITVLLERLFQFSVLNNEYSTYEIFDFIRNYKVVKSDNSYINVSKSNDFIISITNRLQLPLRNYYLTEKQIKKVLNYKV